MPRMMCLTSKKETITDKRPANDTGLEGRERKVSDESTSISTSSSKSSAMKIYRPRGIVEFLRSADGLSHISPSPSKSSLKYNGSIFFYHEKVKAYSPEQRSIEVIGREGQRAFAQVGQTLQKGRRMKKIIG